MNKLALSLALIVREKVRQATLRRVGTNLESRSIFHGPPLELLKMVFTELTLQDGIHIQTATGDAIILPVLMQLPPGQSEFSNPSIGKSGMCDETHLLDLRNVPACPSFIALVPPGQHSNRSVTSTTDEFGVSAPNNSSHATFEDWWGDAFIQSLVTEGLTNAGFQGDQIEESRNLVEHAAKAMDELDPYKETRKASWQLLSRIFSIKDGSGELSKEQALSLSCGVPTQQDATVPAKAHTRVLHQLY